MQNTGSLYVIVMYKIRNVQRYTVVKATYLSATNVKVSLNRLRMSLAKKCEVAVVNKRRVATKEYLARLAKLVRLSELRTVG